MTEEPPTTRETVDTIRQQIAAELRLVAQARCELAAWHPQDREIYEAEARAYRNAAAIAEGDGSMVQVLVQTTIRDH